MMQCVPDVAGLPDLRRLAVGGVGGAGRVTSVSAATGASEKGGGLGGGGYNTGWERKGDARVWGSRGGMAVEFLRNDGSRW